MGNFPALIPELYVTNLAHSKSFWCDLIGFEVVYSRPEENFVQLQLGQAFVMLDQLHPDHSWLTGAMEYPLGRGINLEIEVPDVEAIAGRLQAAGWPIFRPIEEQWYRANDRELGVRQFLVQDPDGYLLRPQQDIGDRQI